MFDASKETIPAFHREGSELELGSLVHVLRGGASVTATCNSDWAVVT